MSYWAAAQLQPNRTSLALHCLTLAGYEVYHPRLRVQRRSHGRRILVAPPLFSGYCFVAVELQWHTVRWTPGVVRVVLDSAQLARVPDAVIAEIRARARNGLVEVPKREMFHVGDQMRILQGPIAGQARAGS